MSTELPPLDSKEAIEARYRALLLEHPVRHVPQINTGNWLFAGSQPGQVDHAITAGHSQRVPEYLGPDVASAQERFYRDLVDQLDAIRSHNFTRDHENHSGAGFPERDALNPNGKPSLYELVQKAQTLAEEHVFVSPEDAADFSHGQRVLQENGVKDLRRTLNELHARYSHALDPKLGEKPLLDSRRALLAYSRDLIDAMHEVACMATGVAKSRDV